MYEITPKDVEQLCSGRKLSRDKNGMPVYRPGQFKLANVLWCIYGVGSSAKFLPIVEKVDRVSDDILFTVAEEIEQRYEDSRRQYQPDYLEVAGMCLVALLAVKKTRACLKQKPARVIKRAVL